jgi:hypothetical protein
MTSRYWQTVAFLLQKLFDLQQQEWSTWEEKEQNKSEMERSPALQTRKVVSRWRWASLNKTKLDSMFSSERKVDFSSERLVLFLPPLPSQQREFVPVMTLSYEPGRECIEMRVGMYRLRENGEPCGFAFRLESPTSICQGTNHKSIHDFYHIQFIKALESYAPKLYLPDWLPEYQPAICVRANNPVEAILSLVLSLYGMDYFEQFLGLVKSNVRTSDIALLKDLAK